MSEQLGEANGFAHAYSTWISQGNGLDTKRDGVFRYKAGPMKGMTRDQAQMHFQNKVWANASPEWKNEYAQRATSDLLAPSEQSDLEKRKAFASGVTQPQYRQQMPQPTTDNGQVALLPAVYGDGPTPVQAPAATPLKTAPATIAPQGPPVTPPQYQPATVGTGNVTVAQGDTVAAAQPAATNEGRTLNSRVIYPGDDSNILAGPPTVEEREVITKARFKRNKAAAQQRNATSVAKTAQAIQGKAPSNTPAGKFDIMKADYSTLTPEQKAQRTQANVDRMKQKASSMGMTETMPAMTVTAPRMKPLETKYDMAQGRVVQTGGDATEEFTNYDKAQKAAQAGTATAQQRQNVTDFVSQDVLGRQPEQIAKLREDERKGYYQAGRYVGPAQPVAPRMPVSAPVFASGGKRSNPAPVATRQPSFGNRAGTGATRMPI